MPALVRAEHVTTPDDPRLTAYEAGRWYALNGRPLPGGATRDAARGYGSEAERETLAAEAYDARHAQRNLDTLRGA